MTHYHPDWLFNLILKFAVVVSLCTLVLSLSAGVGPLTALLRSGAAFVIFAALAWAASLMWEDPQVEPEPEAEAATNQSKAESTHGTATRPSTVEQPTQPATPVDQYDVASSVPTTGNSLGDKLSAQPATVETVASRTE